MILISHRGNIKSIHPERENTKEYIDEAISSGYDVEIDVRLIDQKLYLGHDEPDYEVSLEWLLDRSNHLWVHTKNAEALTFLIDSKLRTFFHQSESHVIINNCNLIWSHVISEAGSRSIIPLISAEDIAKQGSIPTHVYGICSDFIGMI